MEQKTTVFTANQKEWKRVKLGSFLVTCMLYGSIALLGYGHSKKIGLQYKLTKKIAPQISVFHINYRESKVSQLRQKKATASSVSASSLAKKGIGHKKIVKKQATEKEIANKETKEKGETTKQTPKSKVWIEKQFATTYPKSFQKMQLYLKIHKHYPFLAKQRGIQGVVQLQIQINKEGKLKQASIIKSSEYAILDKAAIKLVKGAFPLERTQDTVTFTMQVSYALQAN